MQDLVSVVLSSSLIIEDGAFESLKITQEEAQAWVNHFQPKVYCQHETIKILGLRKPLHREECKHYDYALILKAKAWLEFGKEYSLAEIKEIGVEFRLIAKLDGEKEI